VVVEEVKPDDIRDIKVSSIIATKTSRPRANQVQAWTIKWIVQMDWKLSSSYAKDCAICLLDGSGGTMYCEDSNLEQGWIEIRSQPLSKENVSPESRTLSVQVSTHSGQIFSTISEIVLLDLTSSVCTFQLYRTDRECLDGENCRISSAQGYLSDEYLFQSSVESLQRRVHIADPDSGVGELRWSIVQCTAGKPIKSTTPFARVPSDGILIARYLKLDPNDAYCFEVEAKNKQGLVLLTTAGHMQLSPSLPPFGQLWDGLSTINTDWVNSSRTASCSWERTADGIAHYEVRLLQQGVLQPKQCDQQGMDLNSTINIEQIDSNITGYTFNALTLKGSAIYYCLVSACTVAGLCTTSVSDGFQVDTALPCVIVCKSGVQVSSS